MKRFLHFSHYCKASRHYGSQQPRQFLPRFFYWVSMSIDCHLIVNNCTQCAWNWVAMQRQQKPMRHFSATLPLEFVVIDTLGKLIRTTQRNKYLLIISNLFSKLLRTVSLLSISAETIARAFVINWMLVYGPSKWLLSNNGNQIKNRLFRHLCCIMGEQNFLCTTYRPRTNS